MKNELQLFTNEIFGEVQAIEINGKAWFVANEIAKLLGYVKPNNAINSHCRSTLKQGIPHPQSPDKEIEVNLINEYDVIRLIMKSKLPQAQEFEKWIIEEVVPSVLTTGEYSKKPKTQEELAKDSIFGLVYNKIEDTDKRLEAVQHISDYSIIVGKSEVCDDGTITIPMVKKIVVKHYGDILMNYNIFLSEQFCEFSRFLLQQHYLVTKRFPRKIGVGLEKRKAYQPTELFEETFVKQGMAVARVIDERGKVEVTYTKDIEKYIISDTFKFEFFKYLGVDLVETSVAI